MNFVKFLLIRDFLDILILNILRYCSDLYKTYYFLKEYEEAFQTDVYKLR